MEQKSKIEMHLAGGNNPCGAEKQERDADQFKLSACYYIVLMTCSSAFWPRDNLFVEKIIDHDRRIVERAFDGIIIPDIQ